MKEISTWGYTQPETDTTWTVDSAFDEEIIGRELNTVCLDECLFLFKDAAQAGPTLLLREFADYRPQYAYVDPNLFDNLNRGDMLLSFYVGKQKIPSAYNISLVIRKDSCGTISRVYKANMQEFDLPNMHLDLNYSNNFDFGQDLEMANINKKMLLKLYPSYCLVGALPYNGLLALDAYLLLVDSNNNARGWISNKVNRKRISLLELKSLGSNHCFANDQGYLTVTNAAVSKEHQTVLNLSTSTTSKPAVPKRYLEILNQSLVGKGAMHL